MSDELLKTRISLQNLKAAEFASDETLCYSATVLFDGKRIAEAKNEGRGGTTLIDPLKGASKKLAEAKAYAKALPPQAIHFDDSESVTIDVTLEYLVDVLAYDQNLHAAFKRDMKKALCIKAGKLTYPKGVRLQQVADRSKLFKAMREQWGAEIILAELPPEEAFRLYKLHTSGEG